MYSLLHISLNILNKNAILYIIQKFCVLLYVWPSCLRIGKNAKCYVILWYIGKQNAYLHLRFYFHFRFSDSKAIAKRYAASRMTNNAKRSIWFYPGFTRRIAPKREYGSAWLLETLANLVTVARTDASRRHFWRLQFNTALSSCRHPCSYRYCDSRYRWTLALPNVLGFP